MVESLLVVVLVLVATCLLLLLLLLRKGGADLSSVVSKLESVERAQDKASSVVREEFASGRSESASAFRSLREEVAGAGKGTLDSLVKGLTDLGEQQAKRLDAFSEQIAKANTQSQDSTRLLREEVGKAIQQLTHSAVEQMKAATEAQRERLDAFALRLDALTDALSKALKEGQTSVEKQIGDMRTESAAHAQRLKTDTAESFDSFREGIVQRLQSSADLQKQELAAFGEKLSAAAKEAKEQDALFRSTVEKQITGVQETTEKRLGDIRLEGKLASDTARGEITRALKEYQEALKHQVTEAALEQRTQMGQFLNRLNEVAAGIETRMETLRGGVEQRLKDIQEDNTKKLDQMRQTVDEKLQGTLEKRLGDSFKLVSDRLELVHKGLGEMQSLANGVGDLKKVLTNVKARGTWGEVQLGNLLDQLLTREQYEQNVNTKPGSNDRVEYAIRLPGRGGDLATPVWLPIDAKCPQEDYQRLVEAAERGDPEGVRESVKQLDTRIKACAKDICQKYLSPPHTTDFGILFVPTEGLFAEVIRCPGLTDHLQRECRVIVAGPTTLAAMLNSLQMGFRTLAIEKRSSEVWNVLSAVKTEFAQFGEVFDKVKKKLSEASNTIDKASVRTRAMARKLRTVDELPAPEASALLDLVPAAPPALASPGEAS